MQGGWAAKNSSTFARTRRLRNTTRPDASAPCAWKTRFAMSNPIVLTCPTDASSSGRSTPPWHADAVRGRPSHHSYVRRTRLVGAKMRRQLTAMPVQFSPSRVESAIAERSPDKQDRAEEKQVIEQVSTTGALPRKVGP